MSSNIIPHSLSLLNAFFKLSSIIERHELLIEWYCLLMKKDGQQNIKYCFVSYD